MTTHPLPTTHRAVSQGRSGWVIALMLIVGGLATAVFADPYHTPLDDTQPGGIIGVIQPSQGLQTVIAIEPTEIKAYQAHLDATTGRFELRGLPAGEYDLFIKIKGRVFEGVTLQADPEQGSNVKDRQKLLDDTKTLIAESEDFFNLKRIIRIDGTPEQARVLVMHRRTLPTLDPAGNAIPATIRRFDFIDLIKNGRVWQIATDRHVLRQEVPYGDHDEKVDFIHSTALGAILIGEEVRDMGTIDLTAIPLTPAADYPSADLKAPR